MHASCKWSQGREPFSEQAYTTGMNDPERSLTDAEQQQQQQQQQQICF